MVVLLLLKNIWVPVVLSSCDLISKVVRMGSFNGKPIPTRGFPPLFSNLIISDPEVLGSKGSDSVKVKAPAAPSELAVTTVA